MDSFKSYALFYMNDPYDDYSFSSIQNPKDKKFGRKAARRTQKKNIRDYLDEEYYFIDTYFEDLDVHYLCDRDYMTLNSWNFDWDQYQDDRTWEWREYYLI